MEQILEENFPGMFIFRKIFKSKVFMGAEVDAYYETKNFVLIIEMDENQHKPPKVIIISDYNLETCLICYTYIKSIKMRRLYNLESTISRISFV